MKKNDKSRTRTGILLGGGALASGLAASLCCVGPLVFAGLGLGTFGLGAFFERARPVLAGALVVLGGLGLYLAYQPREVECEDGSCKMESASRGNKIVLWLLTLGGAVFALLPLFL